MQASELLDDDYDNEEDEDTQKGRFLTFRMGEEDYGIEIRQITEIVGMQRITKVPDSPEYVKGVINLRGQVLPVTDLRLRFGMDSRDYDERTCIVVVQVRDSHVGLIVDTVNEVVDIPDERISEPPASAKGTQNGFLIGMGRLEERVVMLLNMENVLA
jgi:purine-binding chemotaxis protein CheW